MYLYVQIEIKIIWYSQILFKYFFLRCNAYIILFMVIDYDYYIFYDLILYTYNNYI